MALQGIEVEGVIIKEYPPKEGVSQRTGNAWKSQEFVIQTKDQYPRACLFRVFGADKLEQFNIHQGDTVHVWLDINARPWQDRYFNDINAFRVDHVDPNAVGTGAATTTASQLDPFAAPAGGAQPAAAPTAAAPTSGAAGTGAAEPAADGGDDLPF